MYASIKVYTTGETAIRFISDNEARIALVRAITVADVIAVVKLAGCTFAEVYAVAGTTPNGVRTETIATEIADKLGELHRINTYRFFSAI